MVSANGLQPFLLIVALLTTGQEPPTVDRVLTALDDRSAAIDNATLRAHWQVLNGGREVAWEDAEIVEDRLGRIRVRFKHGTTDQAGKKSQDPEQPTEFDSLFDGEKLIEQKRHEHHDRMGEPLPENAPDHTFIAAQVFDTKVLGRGIAGSHRNPLTYGLANLDAGLMQSRDEHRDVVIESVAGSAGLYSVSYHPGTPDGGSAVAIVDSQKGFVPIQLQENDKEGKTLQKYTFEYQRAGESDLWVPARITRQTFDPQTSTDTPKSEARVVVEDIKVNDPQFDDAVFVAKLEPDTAVWDARYEVNYRVGDEAVLSDQLTALGEKAKQALPGPVDPDPLRPRKRSWGSILFLAVNVAIVAAIALLWLTRQQRHASA